MLYNQNALLDMSKYKEISPGVFIPIIGSFMNHTNRKEISECLQENLITFLDGLPSELVDNICQAVVNYYKE